MKEYTNEEFIEAVKNSTSIRQVLQKLGLKAAGGNYQTFKNLKEKLNVDTSHFKGHGWRKDRTFKPKRSIEKYLSNQVSIQSYKLKQRLFNEGYFEKKCYECQRTTWNNKSIPLELEHIDGNPKNNNIDNLTILCPNCHAQTPTYRGKNKKHNNSKKLGSALPSSKGSPNLKAST